MNRIPLILDSLRGSFWFLPAVLTLVATALAVGLLAVDHAVGASAVRALGWLYTGSAEGARSVLATVAGAIVTVVGLAFSITIVSLQLAAAQLGPRVLRNFMRDRGNQFVLGTFVATFVYCLLVLRVVRGDRGLTGEVFIPHFAITGGVVLAILSAAVLIYFIHHAAVGLQADHVIAAVARDLDATIDTLYPEGAGEGNAPASAPPSLAPDFERTARVVVARATGYVQSVAVDRAIRVAVERDVVVRLEFRPGDLVLEGEPLALVWPADRMLDNAVSALAGAVALGSARTLVQDVRFGVEQLVDIAVRALSSNLRDPITALRCIDRLGAAVARLAGRRLPSPYRFHEGRLRVVAPGISVGEIAAEGFGPIRDRGAASLPVALRLLETLERIARLRDARDVHAALLAETVKIEHVSRVALGQPWERDAIMRQAARVRGALRADVLHASPEGPVHEEWERCGRTA